MHTAMPVKDPSAAIYDVPRYRVAEVSYLLSVPSSTIRSWCFGQGYRSQRGDSRQFVAVLRPADVERRLLSFLNLCELHVLAAVTRVHGIPLQRVRDGLEYVSRAIGADRPLLVRAFETNGVDLFVAHTMGLLNVTKQGQMALRGDLERRLARVEWGELDTPVRLFPFTRRSRDFQESRAVAIDPQVAFGRPVVFGAGVTTEIVGDRFVAGDTPRDMADDYGVGEDQILEALRYEQRLREERPKRAGERLAA